MKIMLIAVLMITAKLDSAQSLIVINEVMYAPSSPNKEWFELYNTSNNSVNIQNWKWKDAAASNPLRLITPNAIEIPPNTYLIVCEDSVNFKANYPSISGIILQSSGWNALNNTGAESIIISNSENMIVDSLGYSNSWGGFGGRSLEKKVSEGLTNLQTNWGTHTGTGNSSPLMKNSVTPELFDLELKSFTFSPAYPVEGAVLELNMKIKNTGISIAENFSLNLFNDIDFDSIPENNELINSSFFINLMPDDSVSCSFTLENTDSGLKQYITKIIYLPDKDTSDNSLITRIYVSSKNSGKGGIVINEIMYDPLTGNSEWIEIFNSSGQSVNIKGWKFRDTSTSIALSLTDLNFKPGDYFILAHDSSILNSYGYLRNLNFNQHIKFSGSLSLNNTGEKISVTDSLNRKIDEVRYSPDWSNPNIEDVKGISLERINPLLNSNDRKNWSSSVNPAGGTPGEINSIFSKIINTNSTVNVAPNPFSPDGDGFEDFAVINYKLNVQSAQMRIKVFDIKGRLVRTLSDNSASAAEGSVVFNGLDDSSQKLRIGIYILFIEAIDDKGGVVEKIKSPVVIAAKL